MVDDTTSPTVITEEIQDSIPESVAAPTFSETVKVAQFEYKAGLQYAHSLMNRGQKRLSARNIQRALFAAIDFGITDSRVKFTNKQEAELAGIFAKVLDLRTILQAAKMKQEKEETNKTEEKNNETTNPNQD